jgi:hypothetical protein
MTDNKAMKGLLLSRNSEHNKFLEALGRWPFIGDIAY